MRMLLRHWLLLALLLIGAPLIGACEVNCKSDKDKTIGERVDEIGEEAEEAVEDMKE
jgi:hypothetical protein